MDMDKVSRRSEQIFSFMLFCITLTMLIVGASQVTCRYVLKMALSWSEEMMRYLYVWMTMLGIGIGIRKKMFTAIDALLMFVEKKSPAAVRVMKIIVALLQLFFFVFLLVYGAQYALKNMTQLSPAMRIPMGVAYCALPVGGLIGTIFTIAESAKLFESDEEKGE